MSSFYPKKVTVRDLVEGYENREYDGVTGYGGDLDIRPRFQRNYVYEGKPRAKVLDTVLKNLPLNTIWWVDNDNGKFEVLDGQQRIISVCDYVKNVFSIKHDGVPKTFDNLGRETQDTILDHELMVLVFKGTDKEKLDWFETINIAGMKLTRQEILNAVYVGPFVMEAKKLFSQKNGFSVGVGGDYIDGGGDNAVDRQGHLQTALKWIARYRDMDAVENYMSIHQHDKDAQELRDHFQNVVDWIKTVFPHKRAEMAKVDWGELYAEYHAKDLNPEELEAKIAKLLKDDEVTSRKGIWPYVLTNQEKHLNLRAFDKATKRRQYNKQNEECAYGGGTCPSPAGTKFAFDRVEADHIVAWRDGGKTEPDNCQILCKYCNNTKGAK